MGVIILFLKFLPFLLNLNNMKLPFYLLAFLQLSLCFNATAQNPTSLPGPITVCPAGDFAGHHHVPMPLWLEEKLHEAQIAKAAGDQCGTINVTYNGFSPAAETVFQAAVDIWEATLQTSVTIEVEANWTVLDEGVLGSAGPNTIWTSFSGAPENHYYPSALADQLHGSDLDPNEPDINANFNSDFDWYLGTDGNPPNDQYDLLSVVLHELGHGLGFISTKNYEIGEGSLGIDDIPYTYDTYLTLGAGGGLLIDITDPTDLGDAFTSDNVYTNSPGATDALSGVFPRHFAPSEYAGGSSISHWNESTFEPGNMNSLMTPQIGPGEAILDPGPITLGLFEDIGWILCEETVNPCVAEELSLQGPEEICPGETTEVNTDSPNTIPDGGGAGVRFNNNADVNIILFGIDFPYSFDNDLNGVLSANDIDLFEGAFDLTTFVYTDPENPGTTICSESSNPVVVNFLTNSDPSCSGNPCIAEDLTLDGPAEICPGETTAVELVAPNSIPAGGGEGIRFSNGIDVNIILSGISIPYSFDNDLNGLLSANDFDLFVGEFELNTFVYTDPDNVGSSICDESDVFAVVNFLTEGDPECNVEPCVAENIELTGPGAICPGETTSVDLVPSNSIPEGGGQGIRFNNGVDVNITLFGIEFPYSFDNDLNGVLSANDIDPFQGEFELNTFVYTDPDDVQNTICSESAQTASVNFRAEDDPECITCLAENLLINGASEICPGETTQVTLVEPNIIPPGGGAGIRFNNGTGINLTLSSVTFPYTFDNDLNGVLSANDIDPFEGEFELNTIVYTDPGDVTNTICSESEGTVTVGFLTENDGPCSFDCNAGELEPDDGNTLCPGFSASILNTDGLNGVAFPSEGGYRLRVELDGDTYFLETLDPQFGFAIDNDLFGVVSGQGDDPLIGVAALTAETFEDSGDPDGSICDTSEELSFEFLAEDDPACVTSVAEFIGTNGWEIFPNPSSDIVSVQFESTKSGNLQLHLVDLQGRVIQSQNAPISIGKINLDLDVNDVAAGYYRVILSMDGSQNSKALIVVRQ